MKIIAKILTVTIAIQLLIPFRCLAQQDLDENIGRLREEIVKLEQANKDAELPAEVRALNREFLAARKKQLNAIMSKRISALQQYLATMDQVLKPHERQAVETSIQNLSAELRGAEPETVANVDAIVRPAAEFVANSSVRPDVELIGPALNRRSSYLLPGVIATENFRAFPAFAVIPRPISQGGGGNTSTARNEELVIDTPASKVPEPKEVENGSVVTVNGRKRLVDECTVTTKREELKPEPNPLAAFLKILIGLGPIPLGKLSDKGCPVIGSGIEIPTNLEAKRIEEDLEALQLRVVKGVSEVNKRTMDYSNLGDKINAFTNCQAVRVIDAKDDLQANRQYKLDPICTSVVTFDAAKMTIQGQVEVTLALEFPVIVSAELELATLKKALTDYRKEGGDPEQAWITDVSNRLDCNAKRLSDVKKELASLQASREQFETFLKLLSRHITKDSYEKELIADSNAKVSGNVTCTNYFTKQPSFDPIPFTVTYQGFSRHAISAGVLFSTLNKRQIGITPVRTGTAADGSSTFRLTFTETDKADGQVIPFSFYTYRLWGNRKFNLNGSGGVGINPNNGATQVEFFFGTAFGFKNIFVHLGGHAGRWQELGGGFTLGDFVPAVIPVPIERRYTIRPSVGVSYKIPLP